MYRPPASVAGWAADLDLPVGVAQVLLAGLREWPLIHVHHPTLPAGCPARES